MRTTQANRYARWAAIIATVLAVGTVVVYVRHSMQARDAQKNVPPTVPAAVEKSSQTFTYTSGDKDSTLFILRASTVTVFKDTNRSVLDDVWITMFGRKGVRSDNIHTRSCEYFTDPDRFYCAGVVDLDLETADEAKRIASAPPGSIKDAHIVHATTKAVTFNKDSGDATTDQRIDFTFPGGVGNAIGANYHSGDGVLILRSQVDMTLTPATPRDAVRNAAAAAIPPLPIHLTGTSMELRREAHTMVLHGPVVAAQELRPPVQVQPVAATTALPSGQSKRELHASLVTVDLDKEFHASRVTATGDDTTRPQIHAVDAKGNDTVTADQFIGDLAPEGWIEKLSAAGNVQGEINSVGDVDHISAARLDLDMIPKLNQPKTLNANGSVKLNSTRGPLTRSMETASMVVDFVPGPLPQKDARQTYRPGSAHSLAPATVILHQPIPGQAASQQRVTRITGQRIESDFSDGSHLHHMAAHGGSELEQDLPGSPPQISTSQDLAADFDSQGEWTTLDQSGNVHLRSADRTGQAASAHADRATNVVTLTGSAEANDAASRTTADSIIFNQTTNDLRADGHVLSTYQKPPGSAGTAAGGNAGRGMGLSPSLGPDPAHITAEHLVGNSASGHAVYSGHARMWQGDSTMEADEIDLNRVTRQIDARGNVRAVFVQVDSSSAKTQPGQAPKAAKGGTQQEAKPVAIAAGAAPGQPDVWHIHSGTLTYYDDQSKAHLDHNFTMESQKGFISGKECDLFFTSAPGNPQPAQNGPVAPGAGESKHLDHAVATGNVIVKQEDRRGTSDRADYDAAAGKFVLSGGNPTFYDEAGNSTRGRSLTLFLADDTILVESDEGSRTFTHYRVKK